MITRRSFLVLAGTSMLVAACGGAGVPAALSTPTPAATATPVAAASPTPTPLASAATLPIPGGTTFTVQTGSKAIVRVTEQLADRQDLSDAVLTSEKMTGEFTLLPDGTFAPSSKIVVDLTALASDNRQRDSFIRQDTLQTRQFPEATFVPTNAEGLTSLPESGELAFKLTGNMTIRGITKPLTFDVKAKRSGSDLTATATVVPAFRFATFNMQQPRVFSVVSIKDEIRLEVQVVAKQK